MISYIKYRLGKYYVRIPVLLPPPKACTDFSNPPPTRDPYVINKRPLISILNKQPFKYHVSCTDGKISVRNNLFLLPIFPPSSHPSIVCFFPVGISLLIQHFQQVLWVLKCLLSQKTERTSTPTRPVENVVLTMKGL